MLPFRVRAGQSQTVVLKPQTLPIQVYRYFSYSPPVTCEERQNSRTDSPIARRFCSLLVAMIRVEPIPIVASSLFIVHAFVKFL